MNTFFLKHRGETRGVGGIFYDYQDSQRLYKGQDPSGPAAQVSSELGPRPIELGTAVLPRSGQWPSLSACLCPDR